MPPLAIDTWFSDIVLIPCVIIMNILIKNYSEIIIYIAINALVDKSAAMLPSSNS